MTSVLALVMAVPVGLGVAIYITQYAPRRIATVLGYVDRHARGGAQRRLRLVGPDLPAPPSGRDRRCSSPNGSAGSRCSRTRTARPTSSASRSSAQPSSSRIMILPIIAAISREVLRQVDPGPEGSRARARRYALGDDPDRRSFPRAGPGSSAPRCSASAARSARRSRSPWSSATPQDQPAHPAPERRDDRLQHRDPPSATPTTFGRSALIASGLVLFVLTLAVNLIARYVILRSGTEERSAV